MKRRALVLIYALLVLLDALRLQTRAKSIPALEPSEEPIDPRHVFWTIPGLELDDATRRAASAFARANNLEVVDIWPARLKSLELVRLLSSIDPAAYKKNAFAAGQTAGQALLVNRELIERSRAQQPADPITFMRAARVLKRYTDSYGTAIAPGVQGVDPDPGWRLPRIEETVGPFLPLFNVMQLVCSAAPILAIRASFRSGLLALVLHHLNPSIATGGSALEPTDAGPTALLRVPLELFTWVRSLLNPQPLPPKAPADIRETYAGLLAGGVDRFLEPRVDACPICGGANLKVHVESHDVLMLKPGVFTLERCEDCGHVFQNPRLTIEGLDFYYRDAYDGLGGDAAQSTFDGEEKAYRSRAERLKGYSEPRHWLDVGSGYAHFCRIAREVWPQTEFDALDMGQGIDEAERRGWVHHAYRGLFPDIAKGLKASYDVVSMSHYLEHTRDPRAELRAAHDVIRPGGYLLIEVPNPVGPQAHRLGRWWFGWFQPQHQHLLNEANFKRLFAETGFEPVQWHWKEAHVNLNFAFAAWLKLNRAAPMIIELPWLPKPSALQRISNRIIWTLCPFYLVPALLTDILVGGSYAAPGKSFNYGVLARRIDSEGDNAAKAVASTVSV